MNRFILGTVKIEAEGELKVTQVQPAEPVEHQPVRIFFTLTNTSRLRELQGRVTLLNRSTTGSGEGVQIGVLKPGQSVERFLDGVAPAAGRATELEFGLWAPPPVPGTEVLAPALRWSAPIAVAAMYELRIDSVIVDNPRATRNDTLWGEATVLFGGAPVPDPDPPSPFDQPGTQTQSFGNRGAGSVLPTHFRFGPIVGVPGVAPPVKFNYIFSNKGFEGSAEEVGGRVLNTLSQAGQALATFAIAQGSAAFDKANEVHQKINNALFSNCDGIVAADQIEMNSEILDRVTVATGKYSENRAYVGTSSPVVCGQVSHYHVLFSVTRTSFQ